MRRKGIGESPNKQHGIAEWLSRCIACQFDRLNDLEEQLYKVLPEEAIKLFKQYRNASSDLAEITGEQGFISGYQLGVKMIMAGIGRSEEG